MVAVDGLDIEIREGEVVGIIGPNGAGKTTLIDLLSGAGLPDVGRVLLDDRDVTSTGLEGRARAGIVRSFQQARLFPTLTVLDTLRVAQELETPTRPVPAVIGTRGQDRRRSRLARELATSFGLDAYVDAPIRTLSTGTRRVCELACMTALRPRFMLLDEPSAGLAQPEVDRLGPLLLELRDSLKTSLVIVEHDMRLITSIADRLVALDRGKVVAEGPPEQVTRHPDVVAAYLGQVSFGADPSPAGSP